MTKVEIALSYLEKGFSVIPLYSPEMLKRPSPTIKEEYQKELTKNKALKEPLAEKEVLQKFITQKCKQPFIGWKKYQHQLPTREEVTHWFTKNPTANIGIITGAASNLVVFDLDSPAAVHFAEEMGGFPDTVKVKTGRGYHIYMKYPGFEVRDDVNRKLKLDIRADGGQVAAPPSIHGSGHQYEWVEGASIFDIEPAECSQWMIDYLKDIANGKNLTEKEKELFNEIGGILEPVEKTVNTVNEIRHEEAKTQDKKQTEYEDLLQNGCSDGNRNDSATRLIGHFLKTGMKETEVWEIIKTWNEKKVKPPLGEDELKKTFDSIKTAEKKTQTTTPKFTVESLLDNFDRTISEYQQNYVRISFAGDNLTNLENQMNGGFSGGRFYLFGGIPSSGKTVLLNNIADNICLEDYPVLFFSYDDGRAELRYRTFSRFSGQTIEDFNLRTVKDIRGVWNNTNVQQIISRKYVVQQMIPLEKWTELLINPIKQKHGNAPVIIIDYLRKLRTERSTFDERLRVDDILSKLTEMAKYHNIPIIAISELARDSYKSGQRLSMASFKESGTIEYEASWLGILGAVEEKDGDFEIKEDWDSIIEHDGNVDLIIFKAKRGTGVTGRIPLKVDKNLMTVSDRPVEPKSEKKKKPSQFE
ncbi:MAG: bifunctional DNA primase/polymerase [Smithella sp.]|nr:bifunctional DNA primase/polymerase [Smithella sp.]